jgi:tetratricopeptide (TPR) repeat protein
MLKIFISYKFQDAARNEWVDKFYKDLRDIGIDAKLYNYEVAIGESFSDYMARGIRECDYFLFIITPEAVKAVESGKGAVAFEMQIANARRMKDGLKIIPIFREGTETSIYLLDHRYLDFRDDDEYDLKFSELLQWLFEKVQPPALGDHAFESERDTINHARELTKSARNDFNNRNYSIAQKKLEIAVHLDTGDNATWALLGRTLTNLGRFDEAISPLTRAIEHTAFKGNRALYLTSRLLANYFRCKYDLALLDAEKIIAVSPKEKEVYRLRATIWTVLNDLEKALTDINTSLEKGKYLTGHAIKAIILYKIGDEAGALKELDTCNTLGPDDGVDFYCIALAYANIGNKELAFEFLEKSIQNDSKCLPRAMVDPLFEVLTDDPRFETVLSKSSLPSTRTGNE